MIARTAAPGGLRPGRAWRNWGRSVAVRPQLVARPTGVDEVVAVVSYARELGLGVKPIGAGHSFSGIAVAPGIQLDLSALTGLHAVDAAVGRVTIGAGTKLHDLPRMLEPHGLALENLGDIDTQTVSGATSTGTHGTGSKFRGLAAQIVALTLVTAGGSVMRVSETENAELLPAARLGLGALGVIVDLTLQCVPAFLLHALERPEPLDAVLESFQERASAVDHFEFYWFPHTKVALTKSNERLPLDTLRAGLGAVKGWFDDMLMSNGVFSLTCAAGAALPSAVPAINRLATRLTGDREYTDAAASVFTTARRVRFREMEYALPVAAVPEALREVRDLIERKGWRISFPLEVRVAAADDLWLSTAYGRETGYVAVHRYYRDEFQEYFRSVERIMRGHAGRPHWGKIHYQNAAFLAEGYPRFHDFLAVRDRLDPDRVFANRYLSRVLGP